MKWLLSKALSAGMTLTIAGVMLLSAAGVSSALSVNEAVRSVEKHYERVADLAAKVKQKNHFASLGKTQVFEGTLWIKKPGKLRLEYSNGQLIVVNGNISLFYSKKSGQVIKKTFTDFEHMNIPVAFLLGAAHIRDDFEVTQPDPKREGELELVPKKQDAVMTKLKLQSDESGRISSLTIFDRSGNVTEITFTDIHEAAGLEDKLFSFKIPKGTEIIEQ